MRGPVTGSGGAGLMLVFGLCVGLAGLMASAASSRWGMEGAALSGGLVGAASGAGFGGTHGHGLHSQVGFEGFVVHHAHGAGLAGLGQGAQGGGIAGSAHMVVGARVFGGQGAWASMGGGLYAALQQVVIGAWAGVGAHAGVVGELVRGVDSARGQALTPGGGGEGSLQSGVVSGVVGGISGQGGVIPEQAAVLVLGFEGTQGQGGAGHGAGLRLDLALLTWMGGLGLGVVFVV